MAATKTCETCEYWQFLRGDTLIEGYCHRYAPVAESRDRSACRRPIVHSDCWCGDYKNKGGEEEEEGGSVV